MVPTTKWVVPAPKKTLVVGVADMIASNDPVADLVTYSLGSCIGVTVYDPAKKVGGLFHVMLPDSTIDAVKAQATPYMFVDAGLPRLFHAVYNLGGDRARLVIKVAGGSQFLDSQKVFNIGERNYQAVRALLERNGLPIRAADVGGLACRTVRLSLATGEVTVQSPGIPVYQL